MKTKKSDLVVIILITVVGIILVGLLIAWLTGVFKDKKQDLNNGTEKIDGAINSMADFDLQVYDGNTVNGETMIELIGEFKDKGTQLAIGVQTLDSTIIYYNYGFTEATSTLGVAAVVTPPPSKSTAGYITPSANFRGEIIKNTNDEIVCLMFTQQK